MRMRFVGPIIHLVEGHYLNWIKQVQLRQRHAMYNRHFSASLLFLLRYVSVKSEMVHITKSVKHWKISKCHLMFFLQIKRSLDQETMLLTFRTIIIIKRSECKLFSESRRLVVGCSKSICHCTQLKRAFFFLLAALC